MRTISLFLLTAILLGLPIAVLAKPSSSKESITIEIDADLLKRAQAHNIDLASVLEGQLKAKLGGSVGTPPTAYLPFLTAAFDNFESMMFAPAKVTAKTPIEEVRNVCKAMNQNAKQLVVDAKNRKSMPLPTSLEEAKKLDEFIQRRFQAFQGRAAKVGKQMEASTKIMQAKCSDLDLDEKIVQEAMKTMFAGYGPAGWCQSMRRKPQSEWNMDDAGKFVKFCAGAK